MSDTSDDLHLGAVLQINWDARPIRIIALDDVEVFYDCWWPHDNVWGFGTTRGTCSYYRVPRKLLAERSKYVRTEIFTPSEESRHRPDLPLRLAALRDVDWPVEQAIAKFSEAISFLGANEPLRASKLVLCPFGPKGGSKKGIVVIPADGEAFSVPELLILGARIQAPNLRNTLPTSGIGLYRLGLQNGVPSFYLWGHRSQAELPS